LQVHPRRFRATIIGESVLLCPAAVAAGTVAAGTVAAGTVAAGTVAAGTVAAGTVADKPLLPLLPWQR
jgi:hypothetical protein